MQTENKKLLRWLIGAYLIWNLGIMGANYVLIQGYPLYSDALYFIVIGLIGVIVPIYVCKKFKLGCCKFPQKMTFAFLLFSIILVLAMFFLGLESIGKVGDDEFTFAQALELDPAKILNLILYLIPTALALTYFYFGMMLDGFKKLFGKGWGAIGAILITAAAFGLFNFTAVEEWGSVTSILEQVLLMFAIGIGIGIYAHLLDGLFFVFIGFLTLEWFNKAPDELFYREFPESAMGVIIILAAFLLYYFFIGKKLIDPKLKKEKIKFTA
ncbi:hypothetical protein KKC88_02870 [Patescibacteria group bacterium]|nr:hypothetical protein [Patescibacteria group bacterium]MBU1673814.1 hypothetical protein [Patescibacteria group bacterium]MBU1964061.1 hypothetical protein [Patescibacteria group bacterium]